MNIYKERPRKGSGTECCLNHYSTGSDSLNHWRRLLPIAFTAENAQKVHAGTKTQTRRLLNPQPPEHVTKLRPYHGCDRRWIDADGSNYCVQSRYRVGDVLWIQQPWRTQKTWDSTKPTELFSNCRIYMDDAPNGAGKLRPGRFLPLRFARPHRYEVTSVRLERVNEISNTDAVAEGVENWCPFGTCNGSGYLAQNHTVTAPVECRCADLRHREAFGMLWNSIHTKLGTQFEDAPWVFAYTFRRIQ